MLIFTTYHKTGTTLRLLLVLQIKNLQVQHLITKVYSNIYWLQSLNGFIIKLQIGFYFIDRLNNEYYHLSITHKLRGVCNNYIISVVFCKRYLSSTFVCNLPTLLIRVSVARGLLYFSDQLLCRSSDYHQTG